MSFTDIGIGVIEATKGDMDLIKQHLDHELLDEDGIIRLLPAAHYSKYSWRDLRLWMHMTPAYNIPTVELIEQLRYIIGVRPAIEIGAGNGWLAHHLGIRATDLKIHDRPEIRKYIKTMGQFPITYGKDVEKLEATEAVRKYRPDVVIGSWIVQYGESEHVPFSSPYGVNETEILNHADYVLCGTDHGHSKQLINRFKHETYRPPMISRQLTGNFVRVWDKKPPLAE